ncbi:hypothetical protein [Lacipirellula parvula]|uniref:Uncharacterized protein n=1 Tax=Lacipirellula parvula TaxID=2650471 RepID=A0A5K7XD13_9BACT|nr:hypothetical protein [Lacipirellula parvula]BBO32276.1 hypothetical protein PLANPX_1888 [Lacipirellula parvula]
MRHLSYLLAAAFCVTACASANAVDPLSKPGQAIKGTSQEYRHHAMYLRHRHTGEYAGTLHEHAMYHAASNTEISQPVAIDQVNEIEHQLQAAEKQLTELEASLTAAEKAAAKDHLAAIHQQHALAAKHVAELKSEIAKPKPAPAKVAEQAEAVQKAAATAGEAHDSIMKSQGVTPPKAAAENSIVVKK